MLTVWVADPEEDQIQRKVFPPGPPGPEKATPPDGPHCGLDSEQKSGPPCCDPFCHAYQFPGQKRPTLTPAQVDAPPQDTTL